MRSSNKRRVYKLRKDISLCSACLVKLGEFDILTGRRICPTCREKAAIMRVRIREAI